MPTTAENDRLCERCGRPFRPSRRRIREGRLKFCRRGCAIPEHEVPSRFWLYVIKDGPIPQHVPNLGPCWLWKGSSMHGGYGTFATRANGARRNVRAHRYSFFLHHGRWPQPCALHKCDNPACVNPAHLFEGTRAENTQDMLSKGRHRLSAEFHGEKVPWAKLSVTDVRAIRAALSAGQSARSLADRYGVTATAIRHIGNRKTWKAA